MVRSNHDHSPATRDAAASDAPARRLAGPDGASRDIVVQDGRAIRRTIELPEAPATLTGSLYRAVQPGLKRVLGFHHLNAIHSAALDRSQEETPHQRILRAMNVQVDVNEDDLAAIPRTGPLVVVANHPFGGIEGVVLAELLTRVRPEARLMANFLLDRIPLLEGSFFCVDPFGGEAAARRNLATLRTVMKWVGDGNCLGVFPAGEVSHASLRERRVIDPPWATNVARIIRRTNATVVPIFFGGQNGMTFQVAGLVHPRLRTLMLPRAMADMRNRTIRVVVGSAIAPDRLERFDDDRALIDYTRARTYMLRGRLDREDDDREADRRPAPALATIAAPDPAAPYRAEIDALADDTTLVRHGRYRVLAIRGREAPAVMREIGRLREHTFREVGEGTGDALDIDRFDRTYVQLVLWDDESQEIAGGYRLGPTDEIVPADGVRGLYTHTLFDYRERLLEQLGPALELGRSFVVPAHQRGYAPLMLLWKAIGAYVCREPRYRMLFGPVSISNAYHSMSRTLLIEFLLATRFLEPLARLIRPRHKVRLRRRDGIAHETGAVARDLEDVEAIVRDIEAGRRSIPVLLRQYLKLNGKLLAFNVDPDFGDVVDGLMVVDLLDVDPRVLRHYMGKDASAAFLAHHADRGAEPLSRATRGARQSDVVPA